MQLSDTVCILKRPYAITRLTAHFMCGLTSDLVICKFWKSMVMHDTECPYWDQVLSNNTNSTQLTHRYLSFLMYMSHLRGNVNVNVSVYSLKSPLLSANCTNYIPGIGILSYSLISSGENSAFARFAAAIANHYNLAFSSHQLPITAGWTEVVWYERLAQHLYTWPSASMCYHWGHNYPNFIPIVRFACLCFSNALHVWCSLMRLTL